MSVWAWFWIGGTLVLTSDYSRQCKRGVNCFKCNGIAKRRREQLLRCSPEELFCGA